MKDYFVIENVVMVENLKNQMDMLLYMGFLVVGQLFVKQLLRNIGVLKEQGKFEI